MPLKDIILTKIRKPRVIFDMDDVIFDFLQSVLDDYNKDHGTHYTLEDCTKWNLSEIFGNEINKYIYKPGRFLNLKVKNNAAQYIKDLIDTNRYDVFIVTACPHEFFIEKSISLENTLPFFNKDRLIPTSEKTAIWGDVIIDDKVDNVKAFDELIGEGILYDMPHNRGNYPYKRISSLKNIIKILDEMFYPKLKQIEQVG